MSRFHVKVLGLDVLRVQRRPLGDERGALTRLFDQQDLAQLGWGWPIAQINWVENAAKGTVRGLHYQVQPHAEAKLLWCMAGEIHDVVVDVRCGSPSFLKHVAITLSAANGDGILIPEGFAHGYQCLSDDVKLLYCHSATYAPDCERGLHPLDPQLGLAWPQMVKNLSTRDQNHPLISAAFQGDLF
jgi:dTDP-4-dehydrorhamnose 3,5-epimerase